MADRSRKLDTQVLELDLVRGSLENTVNIAGYRMTSPLGAGPRGPSHRATHLQSGEQVTLKLLTGPFTLDVAWRTLTEVRAAVLGDLGCAAVIAPTVWRLDEIAWPDPCQWIVSPWIEGQALPSYIEDSSFQFLPPDMQAARLHEVMLELCKALEEIHANQLEHGGLAPSKIIVSSAESGAVRVALLDAHLSPVPRPSKCASTGAPADADPHGWYAAPEICHSGEEPDTRSDIWSIGAIALEALLGVRLSELEGVDETGAPLIPPERVRRLFEEPSVQERLAAFPIPALALRRDPAERPADARELMERATTLALAPTA